MPSIEVAATVEVLLAVEMTFAKIRSGGQQTVVVLHINVGDAGQAGQVNAGAKRRKGG